MTLSQPRLSIIVPLYNKAPYVRKALESIMSQTYKDFDLIIVDDGSTDNSLEVVNEYIRDVLCVMCDVCKNVRVIQQNNAGVAAARNKGVKESEGEYVCFLDADDWWKPNYLEEMDKLITDYPDAGLFATNYIYYKPGKTHVALKLSKGYINYPEAYLESIAMPVWTGAACMPRRVFDEMGGFPVGIKLGEDFLLWAKTALHYKVAFCEKPLAYYNNDVPAPLRATRNLHAPDHNMLFHFDPLIDEINRLQSTSNKSAWIQLIDKLRVDGLLDYWMSKEYHDAAAVELERVACPLPKAYSMPLWWLRAKKHIMTIGSYCKQRLIRK